MGICWTRCCSLFRRESSRLQRAGGGSKYFRTCSRGEHFTIEFENLVESDEGESPGSSQRPLSEEEISDLRERRYESIANRQQFDDIKLQDESRYRDDHLEESPTWPTEKDFSPDRTRQLELAPSCSEQRPSPASPRLRPPRTTLD
ncbi:AP-1 complex-associated regulatory isoform X1 [Pelobates cultripes]|uniref:AP-1 complex-associated regulatory isoform X1 n=1 Tax=Pelobates cultripes TaxID=61616 RepID=A0AAD1WE65_PELCU|nr:AP-1 complex-associated regulatory isoform X1 [Pelobates cultripes]